MGRRRGGHRQARPRRGEALDGEGGSLVFGRLTPSTESRRIGGLPIGLAHRVRLRRAVARGQAVRWEDVEIDAATEAVRVRREMEAGTAGTDLTSPPGAP